MRKDGGSYYYFYLSVLEKRTYVAVVEHYREKRKLKREIPENEMNSHALLL